MDVGRERVPRVRPTITGIATEPANARSGKRVEEQLRESRVAAVSDRRGDDGDLGRGGGGQRLVGWPAPQARRCPSPSSISRQLASGLAPPTISRAIRTAIAEASDAVLNRPPPPARATTGCVLRWCLRCPRVIPSAAETASVPSSGGSFLLSIKPIDNVSIGDDRGVRSPRDAVPPDHPRGPRLRLISGRRRQGRPRGNRRSPVGHRALSPPLAPPWRPHRARGRDAQPRRPRLRPRQALRRDRRHDPHPQPAEAEYPHEALGDGAVLELGGVEIEAIHTPGHRPEHTSLLLRDRGRGGEPWAVLTGDSLSSANSPGPTLRSNRARVRVRSSHRSRTACSPA